MVAECKPGASVAKVEMAQGINANVVTAGGNCPGGKDKASATTGEFIALPLALPP